MHPGFHREGFHLSGEGVKYFSLSSISQKWHILVTKNFGCNKIRIKSGCHATSRSHVVAKMGISPNFENLERGAKIAYFGTFHTFNILHGKRFEIKCGRTNVWIYFRQKY